MNALNNNSVTHQYVGPYFVPHGWTAWNNQTAYQPLAVVSYNLAWYILKKPAPVGTLPTDQEYWAHVDNWQGQIADIENQLNNIYNELFKNEGQIKTNQNYLIILDSFGNMNPGVTTPLGNQIQNYAKINADILIQGGMGFSNPDKKLLPVLQNWVSNNPSKLNKNKILIIMGTNDQGYQDNISVDMVNCISYINSTFNNPKISIYFSGVALGAGKGSTAITGTRNQYKDNALKNGCDYFDLSLIPLGAGMINSDNTHPTQTGVNELAKAISYSLYNQEYKPNWKTDPFGLVSDTNYDGAFVLEMIEGTPYLSVYINAKNLTLSGNNIVSIELPATNKNYPLALQRSCTGYALVGGNSYNVCFSVNYINGKITLQVSLIGTTGQLTQFRCSTPSI